jgi:hypothetical protein
LKYESKYGLGNPPQPEAKPEKGEGESSPVTARKNAAKSFSFSFGLYTFKYPENFSLKYFQELFKLILKYCQEFFE